MTEITIRTEDEVVLQKLLQFIKDIGLDELVVESTSSEKDALPIPPEPPKKSQPSIQWAENPEKAQEFFGIWKDNPKNLQQLRNKAWGGRT
ncbi:MAG: hypothetical protein AAF960_19725 [Bacteroidota bacterium]